MKKKLCRLLPFAALMVATLFVATYVLELDAYARAGGGRSSGSRGSRSSYSPSKPSPSQSMTSPTRSMTPTPAPQPVPQKSGFWRTFGGAMAGGLLGGLLFSSLGFGHGGGFGGGGGGIGIMDIIILAALLYFVYWFFKRRKAAKEAEAGSAYYQNTSSQPVQPATYAAPAYAEQDTEAEKMQGIGYIRQMDPSFDESRFAELCMDIFFKVQGAWGNRDLSAARQLLTDEMFRILQSDADQMKQDRKINKLENIAVRNVDITEAWQEGGKDFITVRFLANLLDYTVSETGDLLSGSKTDPVKFEEYWTFVRPVGSNPWQLSAIDQA